jgi:hypothetical protein
MSWGWEQEEVGQKDERQTARRFLQDRSHVAEFDGFG